MSLAAKLQLRQSQSLVMTPQLMQSIRLLQLTHFELDRFVDEEIERNPLLERVETGDEGTVEPQAEARETAAEDPDWFSEDNGGLDARAIAGEFDAMEVGRGRGIAVRGGRRFRSRGFRSCRADVARPYRRADQLRVRQSG